MVAGALAGGVGAWAAHLLPVHRAQLGLQLLAGLFMICWACIWPVGKRCWAGWNKPAACCGDGSSRWVDAGCQCVPRRKPWASAWCGVGYPAAWSTAILVWAIGAGGAPQGALLLLSFGLGTLPALLAMGTAAAALAEFVRRPAVRRVAGSLVILFGIYEIVLAAHDADELKCSRSSRHGRAHLLHKFR